jgi:hypothetical protein
MSTTPSTFVSPGAAAVTIADQLQRIGIKVNIRKIELGVWVRNFQNRQMGFTFNDWPSSPDPSLLYYRHFRAQPLGADFRNWNNAKASELLDRGREESDYGVRRGIYNEFQKILADDVPTIMMFSADLHHVLIRAVAESYALLPAGQMIDPGEFADAAVRFVARSFLLGLRMAMPFLAYATLLFVGLGLMQRLMPQMQVFFVAMPLQVTLGLILFAMGSGTAMIIYLEELERTLGGLLRLR